MVYLQLADTAGQRSISESHLLESESAVVTSANHINQTNLRYSLKTKSVVWLHSTLHPHLPEDKSTLNTVKKNVYIHLMPVLLAFVQLRRR